MKAKLIKKGSIIKCIPCKSLIQGYKIEGVVYFDSWEGEDKCFVSVPNEPIGKRFLIESKNLILEE